MTAQPHHSHAYGGVAPDGVRVSRLPRLVLLAGLGLAALATLVGLWRMWPEGSVTVADPAELQYSAPGVTFPDAVVTDVQPACAVSVVQAPEEAAGQPPDAGYEASDDCGHADVRLSDVSETVTVDLPPEVARAGLRAGDEVQLARIPTGDASVGDVYAYFGTDRHLPILWMSLGFVALVIVVARRRGLMALVALAFSGWMIISFMLPALLSGESGAGVALVGSAAIMFVVLYLTHGVSWRTSAALAGTLLGVLVTAALGAWAIGSTRLTGIGDDSSGTLSALAGDLSFPGLLACGLIIAGLGVLNDVTITQASAVWELRALDPRAPRRRAFTGAMRIGRDHIASTIYTIAFAYAGASIVVLLLLVIYDRPFLELLSSEDIAEEVIRTLASGMALVLAVPITTAIAAAVTSPRAGSPMRRDESELGSADDLASDPAFEEFWGE
jgi:uncharacterized membrane protein